MNINLKCSTCLYDRTVKPSRCGRFNLVPAMFNIPTFGLQKLFPRHFIRSLSAFEAVKLNNPTYCEQLHIATETFEKEQVYDCVFASACPHQDSVSRFVHDYLPVLGV